MVGLDAQPLSFFISKSVSIEKPFLYEMKN